MCCAAQSNQEPNERYDLWATSEKELGVRCHGAHTRLSVSLQIQERIGVGMHLFMFNMQRYGLLMVAVSLLGNWRHPFTFVGHSLTMCSRSGLIALITNLAGDELDQLRGCDQSTHLDGCKTWITQASLGNTAHGGGAVVTQCLFQACDSPHWDHVPKYDPCWLALGAHCCGHACVLVIYQGRRTKHRQRVSREFPSRSRLCCTDQGAVPTCNSECLYRVQDMQSSLWFLCRICPSPQPLLM